MYNVNLMCATRLSYCTWWGVSSETLWPPSLPSPSSPPSPSNTHMHAFTQMSLHSCHSLCCLQTPCSAGGTRGSHCTSISTTARWGLPWHGRQQPRGGRKGGAQQCGGAWHQEEVDRVVELCYSMSSIADIHSTMIGTLLGQACVAPLSVALTHPWRFTITKNCFSMAFWL